MSIRRRRLNKEIELRTDVVVILPDVVLVSLARFVLSEITLALLNSSNTPAQTIAP
jgi:hypothetical protein